MNDKLVVTVLGNRNSGKSRTWNELFGRTVRTGTRLKNLYLSASEYVEVFLVSGSPEERNAYVANIIGRRRPPLVLCSIQYLAHATRTIDYFLRNRYSIYTQWLNPGFSDGRREPDSLGLTSYLLNRGGVVAVRNGRSRPSRRVQELNDFIYGWARSRGLLLT